MIHSHVSFARTHTCSGNQEIRTWWNHSTTGYQVWEGGEGLVALHTRPARVPENVDVVNHARHAAARDNLDKPQWKNWAAQRDGLAALEWCRTLADTGRIPYKLLQGRVFPAGTFLSPPLLLASTF